MTSQELRNRLNDVTDLLTDCIFYNDQPEVRLQCQEIKRMIDILFEKI